MNTLVILTRDAHAFDQKLSEANLQDIEVLIPEDAEQAREYAKRATIILANPKIAKEYINDAKKLKWVQTETVGVDPLLDPKLRRDYVLTNARGILGPKLAEYTFAHILADKKRIFENRELQQGKKWDSISTKSLVGGTIVLLGTGSIGAHIAKVAKAFGMHTVGYRTRKAPVEFFDEIFGADELPQALAKGDYVVCVLPGTKETDNIIRAETIAYMKDGVVFINIGRGNAVVEQDVMDAVRRKKISRAILDVFTKEPLPAENPLWSTDGIIITPHMAGYAEDGDVFDLFAENYERFRAGQELKYIVNFEKGY